MWQERCHPAGSRVREGRHERPSEGDAFVLGGRASRTGTSKGLAMSTLGLRGEAKQRAVARRKANARNSFFELKNDTDSGPCQGQYRLSSNFSRLMVNF